MGQTVYSKKFLINALLLIMATCFFSSIILYAPNMENRAVVAVILFILLSSLALLNAYYVPYAFYFDKNTVQISYLFSRKSKKWRWNDITGIEIETKPLSHSHLWRKINVGDALFRKSFRLEHVDGNGKVEYEFIVKGRKAKRCIDKYRQVEITGA